MYSFIKYINLRKLKIGNYTEFINLIYLSLEHELVARNNMVYPFIRYKNIDKEEARNIVNNSFINKALVFLSQFDHIKFIKSMDRTELDRLTKIFITDVLRSDPNVNIIEFYKNWEKFFKDSSKEWRTELDKEIDDLYEFKTFNNNESVNSVNKILIEIYNGFNKTIL